VEIGLLRFGRSQLRLEERSRARVIRRRAREPLLHLASSRRIEQAVADERGFVEANAVVIEGDFDPSRQVRSVIAIDPAAVIGSERVVHERSGVRANDARLCCLGGLPATEPLRNRSRKVGAFRNIHVTGHGSAHERNPAILRLEDEASSVRTLEQGDRIALRAPSQMEALAEFTHGPSQDCTGPADCERVCSLYRCPMKCQALVCAVATAACAHTPATPAVDHAQTEREIARLEHRLASASSDGAARYQLCSLYDQLARTDDTLRCLAALDALGWSYALDQSDFPATLTRPEFKTLAARFAARDRVVAHSTRAFAASADIVPENIAYDPQADAYFLGSLTQHAVWRLRDGKLAKLFDTGGFAVIGMKIDPARRTLWAATNGLERGGLRGAAVVVADLDSGAVLARIAAPHDGRAHGFNDLVLTDAEEAFVTDSAGGAVWRASRSGALAPVVPAGTFAFPNGIAIAPDHRRLFVAYDLTPPRSDPSHRLRDPTPW
jgi:hypothetical protein